MKQVHPFTAREIEMFNTWTMKLETERSLLFETLLDFNSYKAPISDLQNRILDSKPMSLNDFQFFVYLIRANR